ncbi:unnamed protein product [Bursaphelenchus okinawaensis]|uniref:Uncharacterized protein n=1 Tax=Bursaphelenchus okinawaensis TaxID=465554 RepID=A0A811LMT7_9BILA|nr:unnamed protein product [Bursaphelenchus okinawaensis]CAG9125606.1 unnamed protein product [Bursaphelenchus okinawaensis]
MERVHSSDVTRRPCIDGEETVVQGEGSASVAIGWTGLGGRGVVGKYSQVNQVAQSPSIEERLRALQWSWRTQHPMPGATSQQDSQFLKIRFISTSGHSEN